MQRFFGWALLFAMAAATAVPCGSIAQASVTGSTISIAFAMDEPPGTNGCALDPTDTAGALGYQSANWVNEMTDQGSDTNLTRDDNGVASATTASLTWVCDNTWSSDGVRGEPGDVFPLGGDQKLFNGYLDIGGGGPSMGFTDIEITGLPDDFATGFSVILYTQSGVTNRQEYVYCNDPNLANPLSVTYGGPGGATSYYLRAIVGNYVQAIGDDPTFGPDSYGNYVIFTMNGSSQSLAGTSVSIYVYPNSAQGTPRYALTASRS